MQIQRSYKNMHLKFVHSKWLLLAALCRPSNALYKKIDLRGDIWPDLLTLPKYFGNFWRIFRKLKKFWRIFEKFSAFSRILSVFGAFFRIKTHKSLTYLGRIYRFEIMLASLMVWEECVEGGGCERPIQGLDFVYLLFKLVFFIQ